MQVLQRSEKRQQQPTSPFYSPKNMGICLHEDRAENKLSIHRTDGCGPPAIFDMLVSESESSVHLFIRA